VVVVGLACLLGGDDERRLDLIVVNHGEDPACLAPSRVVAGAGASGIADGGR
jgi:hypothetical protein